MRQRRRTAAAPLAVHQPTLFDERPELLGRTTSGGSATAAVQAPVQPQVIPLAEAAWGMFGEVRGWGHSGNRTRHTGYVTKPPRLYTGGAGGNHKTAKFKGEPLLSLVIEDDGMTIGMYAQPDATFRRLAPPMDRPLTTAKHLERRMPVADLRTRDTFYLWDEPGTPRMHLQADPMPVGGGRYDLLIFVYGRTSTRTMHGDGWVDVEDPERYPWQAAPEPYTLPGPPPR